MAAYLALFATSAQAEPFEIPAIAAALSAPPIVHPDAQYIARTFADYSLPKLINSDEILAKQLGINGFQGSRDALDAPLPIVVLYPQDIREFVKGKTNPFQAINKHINWIRRSDGKLVPARLLFPIKFRPGTGNDELLTWSSVTVGKTPSTPWRITQVGGPKLMRAVKLYATHTINFIVWIPGINRHYLGHLEASPGLLPRIKMTDLFDDPLAGVNAGEDFDPDTSEIIDKLKKLDEGLQPQRGLQGPNTQPQRQLRTTSR